MPKVGKQEFPYTAKGKAAAKAAMRKHERGESKTERMMEYGPKGAAKKKVAKKRAK